MIVNQAVGGLEGSFECGIVCDLLHAEGAEVCGVYGSDFYKGMPCLTRNRVGNGQAWYVASSPEKRFLHGLARHLAAGKGIEPVLRAWPSHNRSHRKSKPLASPRPAAPGQAKPRPAPPEILGGLWGCAFVSSS